MWWYHSTTGTRTTLYGQNANYIIKSRKFAYALTKQTN